MDAYHVARMLVALGACTIAAWFPVAAVWRAWLREPATEIFSVWLDGSLLIGFAFGLAAIGATLLGWAA